MGFGLLQEEEAQCSVALGMPIGTQLFGVAIDKGLALGDRLAAIDREGG